MVQLDKQLEFGKIPPIEQGIRTRRAKARSKTPPSSPDQFGLIGKEIKQAIGDQWKRDREEYSERRRRDEEARKRTWGVADDRWPRVAPSSASMCLRMVGFEALHEKNGDFPPTPPPPEANIAMMIGSSAHWKILKILKPILQGEEEVIVQEPSLGIVGRVDMVFRHPRTKERQILELKTTGNFSFRKITRGGNLPSYLKDLPNVYPPTPEHNKQGLLYLHALNNPESGIAKPDDPVTQANFLYINRDNGQIKEGLTVWNSAARYDTQQFVEQIKQAREDIRRGELPEPSVESSYICSGICNFRIHCDVGQREVVKKPKTRRPEWVYRKSREEAEARRVKMEEHGLLQPLLIPL